MSIVEILFLAVALGLDAFSVAIAIGAYLKIASFRQKFRLSFHFGFFQFAMPIIGWFGGFLIEDYISHFDHWVVFAILMIIGYKMISDGLSGAGESINKDMSKGLPLIILALATSIDALAIGFSLALIRQDIFFVSIIVGVVAAVMTLIGIKIGEKASEYFNGKAFIFGGIILMLLACKILYEHLV